MKAKIKLVLMALVLFSCIAAFHFAVADNTGTVGEYVANDAPQSEPIIPPDVVKGLIGSFFTFLAGLVIRFFEKKKVIKQAKDETLKEVVNNIHMAKDLHTQAIAAKNKNLS